MLLRRVPRLPVTMSQSFYCVYCHVSGPPLFLLITFRELAPSSPSVPDSLSWPMLLLAYFWLGDCMILLFETQPHCSPWRAHAVTIRAAIHGGWCWAIALLVKPSYLIYSQVSHHQAWVVQMAASSKIFCQISDLCVIVGCLYSILDGKNHGLPLFSVLPLVPWFCQYGQSYGLPTWYCLWKLSILLCQLEFHSPWQWLCPDMHLGLLLLCAVLFAYHTGYSGVFRKVGVDG